MNKASQPYDIVIDLDELELTFPDFNFSKYFSLRKSLKEVEKNNDKDNIIQEIAYTTIRDPEMISVPQLTSKVNKNVGIFKIRAASGKNNKGKSGGYRAITLLIAPFSKAYVLDILHHSNKGEQDLSDQQKQYCNYMADNIEKEISEHLNNKEQNDD